MLVNHTRASLFLMLIAFPVWSEEDLPWHLEVNQISDAWEHTEGDDAIAAIIDSEVYFVAALKDKSARKKKKYQAPGYTKKEFLKA